MGNNEILVPEEGTENTEQTVEKTPQKLYTEDELNAKLDEGYRKKIGRREAKIRKEYKPLEDLAEALKLGTGKSTVPEVLEYVQNFYKDKGVDMPVAKQYSEKDVEILARSDADEIISAGTEEVLDELKRLTDLGVDRMTDRERAMFGHLAQHQKNAKKMQELADLGIPKEIYESEEFTSFASMFHSDVPMEKVYENYEKIRPKENIKPMGSVASTTPANNVKDFYSQAEVKKFSREYLDKNPDVYQKVLESMRKW